MQQERCWAEGYESSYDSEYDWAVYDQRFIFDDDDDERDDAADESEGEFDDFDDSQDFVLDEIPFVYCPGNQETGVA